MSTFQAAFSALKDALRLADDVKRAGETLANLAIEVRDQDRRLTRLEAQFATALALSGARRPRLMPGSGAAD